MSDDRKKEVVGLGEKGGTKREGKVSRGEEEKEERERGGVKGEVRQKWDVKSETSKGRRMDKRQRE